MPAMFSLCLAQFINNKVQNSVVSCFGSMYAVCRVLVVKKIDHCPQVKDTENENFLSRI